MDQPDRTIHTETDIKAYRGYMPDDWGAKTVGPIPAGTVLERLLLDLLMSWRSASYTAQMPATTIRAIHATAIGKGSVVTPDSSIVAYSERIIGALVQRVPELTENGSLRSKLMAELTKITADFRDRAAAVTNDIPIEPIWTQFMDDIAFRMSLWESQRVAYVAFYNAYEAFVVRCLKVGTGRSSLRSTDKKTFNEALRSGLAKDVSGPCWSHHEINIARLVRHALSHNDGHETEELSAQKHGIKLIGDELQIVPEDIHRMLRRLRKAVEEMIAATKDDPRFMAPAASPRIDSQVVQSFNGAAADI
ncbi:MAG TPA: hypothetical protein VMR25_01865 [Planctomycetaceae bacterium]|jgi:hypothetical protein|nr:hypothetical protein [Planctomycetaceae bacterium]